MRTYTTTAELTGPPEVALQSAISALTVHGFRLTVRTDTSAVLGGPGMGSSRQHAIRGASLVELETDGERLDLRAELGGVDGLARFVRWFPPALGGSMAVFFLILFGLLFDLGVGLLAAGIGLLVVLPWLFLAPVLARHLQRNTERALETVVINSRLDRPSGP